MLRLNANTNKCKLNMRIHVTRMKCDSDSFYTAFFCANIAFSRNCHCFPEQKKMRNEMKYQLNLDEPTFELCGKTKVVSFHSAIK